MQEMQEAWVQPQGQEDPLRRKWQSAPVFLAWKIPWPEQPGRLQTMDSKELDMTEHTRTQDGRMGSKEENYSNDNWDQSSPALTP